MRLEDGRAVGRGGRRRRHSLAARARRIAHQAQDYGQTAVVANFACSKPHRNTAWQWFQGAQKDGAVLALLPLPGEHVSMVWSLPNAQASRLLALEAAALAREVALAAQHALGELALVTPPRGFPLQRLSAARLVGPRVALG